MEEIALNYPPGSTVIDGQNHITVERCYAGGRFIAIRKHQLMGTENYGVQIIEDEDGKHKIATQIQNVT